MQGEIMADEIDYNLEGNDPGDGKKDPTDEGYDEAAHSGRSRYGVPEGEGGVFGSSGGGTFPGGFQVVEREGIYDRTGEETTDEDRSTIQREEAEKRGRT
jgi:hypothetical protein